MSRHPIEVDIDDQQPYISVGPRRLRRLVRQTLSDHRVPRAVISLALVDNKAIRRLNRRYLAHDYATDVLSFPLDDAPPALVGEVVVSAQTALARSRRLGHAPEGELMLYVVHGLLHLVGFDDASTARAARMHQAEEAILARFGFPDAYWRRLAGRRPAGRSNGRPSTK